MSRKVYVIGAGLAGVEAVHQLDKYGIDTVLYEMRPSVMTEAHKTNLFAELVCSNSFKSYEPGSIDALLKHEMQMLDSIILKFAYKHKTPAGKALAVDRSLFSKDITDHVQSLKHVHVIREEIKKIPDDEIIIIATGPLTSNALAQDIKRLIGNDMLHFYDAISPIIIADSIDLSMVWFGSRYQENRDYINCPMTEQQYKDFVDVILRARSVEPEAFEDVKYFEGCLPVEVMAKRGTDVLKHGPMKPFGLIMPDGKSPYAVVQLRRENKQGTLYNIVGFQTKLKYSEQMRVFRMIPGLEHAEFARYGSIHRNSFINAPIVLDRFLRVRNKPSLFIAGQLAGVEGYMESSAAGIFAGINASRIIRGLEPFAMPEHTAMGALINYITDPAHQPFQPMNINFGLFTDINGLKKDEKRAFIIKRAQSYIHNLVNDVMIAPVKSYF
ncbi:MAG: methylenetetrahydrofolate--tRNA-(uracil(54)-C(5))-methyltransferase (FADH(2)-oxidizing) TrmFO [Deltaproteobacteria bacterium]|nr:methylenetetrahydrofolate--tRNA-(uracil(54)-C(5))-methyltransferase (FADH(2)-oxidizing) TrmFO [Deltaproteobacteria bacterium]